jgi:hypothetical protein
MTVHVSLAPNTTWDVPIDLADTPRLRRLQGIYLENGVSNMGEAAQFCAVLAMLELMERGEEVGEERSGAGTDERTKAVLRDMSAGPLLFAVQQLWPKADRDETTLRREIQFLINRGVEILKSSRFNDVCERIETALGRGVEALNP